MIRLNHVSRKVNRQAVLDDVSLTIDDGQCCGFVGCNGSGKTMLLRAICGFMSLDAGQVMVNGKTIGAEQSAFKYRGAAKTTAGEFIENAGIIIGEPPFLECLSGFENLKVLAEIQNRISDAEILDVMKKMKLYEARDKKVRKYSLGMKQRLRLAQAFMEDPAILILDEPFNALDKQGVSEVQEMLLQEKERGKTILLTSHDDRNIQLLCDVVYEIQEGKISQC